MCCYRQRGKPSLSQFFDDSIITLQKKIINNLRCPETSRLNFINLIEFDGDVVRIFRLMKRKNINFRLICCQTRIDILFWHLILFFRGTNFNSLQCGHFFVIFLLKLVYWWFLLGQWFTDYWFKLFILLDLKSLQCRGIYEKVSLSFHVITYLVWVCHSFYVTNVRLMCVHFVHVHRTVYTHLIL